MQNLLKMKLNGLITKGHESILPHFAKVGYTPFAEAF